MTYPHQLFNTARTVLNMHFAHRTQTTSLEKCNYRIIIIIIIIMINYFSVYSIHFSLLQTYNFDLQRTVFSRFLLTNPFTLKRLFHSRAKMNTWEWMQRYPTASFPGSEAARREGRTGRPAPALRRRWPARRRAQRPPRPSARRAGPGKRRIEPRRSTESESKRPSSSFGR